jgi:hypothetical protein
MTTNPLVTVNVSNIKYDTDGHRIVGLPKKLNLLVDKEWYESDPDSCLADAISDVTGWCVLGFDID